jgi:hypothetical protein
LDLNAIPADNAAAVIDVVENIDLASFRAVYARIAQAKRLKKSPAPRVAGPPVTTITLGIIYAQQTLLPLKKLAEELELLNDRTQSREWPDMVVVGSTGAVQYAVQFPGEPSISGEYLPPAEGALANYTPAIYVVMVMRPTGPYAFNKMISFLVAHLAIFSPGAKLPLYSDILEGVPKSAVTLSGYQYNLRGDLVPVPREFYNDRLLSPPPIRIEDQKGTLLSTIQYVPWQDGGAIVLRGKLSLDGLMVFLGKEALAKGGVIRRPDDLQISHVLPITPAKFDEMLNRLQRQSNIRVRPSQGQFVIQQLADEGSASPFMARILFGLLRLRDGVYSDPAARENLISRSSR